MHRLLAEAPLTEASYSIEACQPTVLQAKHLDIKPSEACLAITRRIEKSGFQGCGQDVLGIVCY